MGMDVTSAGPVALALIVGAAGLLVLLWRRGKSATGAAGSAADAPKEPVPRMEGFPADGIFTLDTLSQFDGERLPLCLCCCGRVVNCSASENIKPGEGYGKLWAGKDATYALATLSLKPEDANKQDFELEDFTEEQHKALAGWFKHFTTKYPVVGTLKEHEGRDWESVEIEAKNQTPFQSGGESKDQEEEGQAQVTPTTEPSPDSEPVTFSSGDRVVIQGLTAKPELNGTTGSLGTFVPEKNRFSVNLDTGGSPMLFKPENLAKLPAAS